ncbi:MAG: flavin reductase family protein [Proteobacteria bacterium]|nr:flavin reductase family protein [Pseudomonadota bacterium]
MKIAAGDLSGRDRYLRLIDTIVPRPIAWVLTLSPTGVPNLAPFSFFNGVVARPPIVSVSVGAKPVTDADGGRRYVDKDTTRNIRHHGAFVVHLAPHGRADQVQRSAEDHPDGTDVPDLLGLEAVPSTWVDVPRLSALPIAMECRLHQIVPVGEPAASLILGEVLGWHVHDELVDADGRVAAGAWDPLARLGIDGYGRTVPN